MVAHSKEKCIAGSGVSGWVTSLLYPLGSRILLPFYFDHIKLIGERYLPSEGPLLIAPTHRSRWDGLVVGHVFGRPATGRDLRYMVSVNEMSGAQGWLIRKFGGFSIDPDCPKISVLRHGVDLLHQEQTLVIFGEGDIFYERTVDYIKPGLARIALQAQKKATRCKKELPVRILPVGLYYSEPVPTRGSSVEVRLGPTMNVQDYMNMPCKEADPRLTQDLKSSLNHLMTWSEEVPISQVSAQPL